ncbi:hypothetical protein [Thalassotalea profundi]|uniref:DUF2897 family protein n=1 Tax=Thalassotalea profundi TaxID=2036687 RepID=A0ABQ3IQ38_9GAMM|nr:hypothetical protein [Thalassotalea profundi]GHE90243.1 hypothetical protein GCM10011501_19550 [Thalassotalea profundi]
MDNWLAWIILIIVALYFVGNLNTFHKSAKLPMRKKNLNDLKETLPRTHKTDHKMPPNSGVKQEK